MYHDLGVPVREGDMYLLTKCLRPQGRLLLTLLLLGGGFYNRCPPREGLPSLVPRLSYSEVSSTKINHTPLHGEGQRHRPTISTV